MVEVEAEDVVVVVVGVVVIAVVVVVGVVVIAVVVIADVAAAEEDEEATYKARYPIKIAEGATTLAVNKEQQ